MATLDMQDANILDRDEINWRWVVYPIVAMLVVVVGGLAIYYYQQSQREAAESQARAALLQAKTPDAMLKVADQFPGTTHATMALLGAADLSFGKKDFDAAAKEYQRALDQPRTDVLLLDSARLGLASSLEANRKLDDAITAYLAVARRGNASPYAPFAYMSAARLYEDKKDTLDEREILTEAAGLGGDSQFVKQAQERLKSLNAAAQPTGGTPNAASPSFAPASAPTGNAAPATNAAH